ncbi:MAG: hypothetical protein LBI42_06575 [Chitinispirillales bacterium]|jgi:hypothetical protein|nr:hypothetical protein [Chitinispirillales bacterium]
MKQLYCHYFDSEERDLHLTDVIPCSNCGVPVCFSSRVNGLCEECNPIRDDPQALLMRALGMKSFYDKCGTFGVE